MELVCCDRHVCGQHLALALALRLDSNTLLAAKVEDADSGGASAAERSQSQGNLLKNLMKVRFILNKHLGSATVVDGSKSA